jgi:hypothetical protein
MEFFEFKGENEYDGILQTWMEELKDLFGKKLLMESEMSDLEESHLRQSGLEINADFNFFGGGSDTQDNNDGTQENNDNTQKNGFFDFDFKQQPKTLTNSETENDHLENSEKEKNQKKVNHLDAFDFDEFDKTSKNKILPESPIKNSSKKSKSYIFLSI